MIVPVRWLPVAFAAAVKLIEPVPVPAGEAGEVIVIQVGSDTVAVQAHADDVFTVKLPPPPVTATLIEFGEREYVHGGGEATVTTTGIDAMRFVAVAESTARIPAYTPGGVTAEIVI